MRGHVGESWATTRVCFYVRVPLIGSRVPGCFVRVVGSSFCSRGSDGPCREIGLAGTAVDRGSHSAGFGLGLGRSCFGVEL